MSNFHISLGIFPFLLIPFDKANLILIPWTLMFYVPIKRPNSLEKINMPYLGLPAINFVQIWCADSRDTFKGRCGLCLTFEGKDHVINRSQVPISYLHTKFEQNRSMDGRDRAYLVFQGCSAFLRVHRMYTQEVYRSGKLCLSLNNHFLPSELFGATGIIVKLGQTWFWANMLLCPLVATFRSKQRLKLSSLNVATSWYTWIFPIFHP